MNLNHSLLRDPNFAKKKRRHFNDAIGNDIIFSDFRGRSNFAHKCDFRYILVIVTKFFKVMSSLLREMTSKHVFLAIFLGGGLRKTKN